MTNFMLREFTLKKKKRTFGVEEMLSFLIQPGLYSHFTNGVIKCNFNIHF